MYTTFKLLHGIVADLSLFTAIISFLMLSLKFIKNKPYTAQAKFAALATLITLHLQLVMGVLLYLVSPLGSLSLSVAMMKNPGLRFYTLEHPLAMITAVILVTVGYSKSKKLISDESKYRSLVIYYGCGLFLILLRIPWQVWLSKMG